MNTPQPTRRTTLLTRIGLVLVGLLSGILIMLVIINSRARIDNTPRLVERVELGNPSVEPVRRVPDSLSAPPASLDLFSMNQSFKDVAKAVTPAVVYIQVEVASSGSERGWLPRFGEPRQSVGSGVLISDSGYIVTNNHVIEGAQEIEVILFDKRQFRARVVGTDPATDLAVIKAIANERLPAAPLGNSDNVEVGEWVIAIGNPFRLTSTVTAGIVSALGRQVDIINDQFRIEDFIQTDAAINPGNSGGALVNLNGQLIGINTAIATETGSNEGYGFAVPVNLVERVARDLISFGEVKRGFLGVTIGEINASSSRRLGLDRIAGVFLESIYPGSAADEAGLEEGDVVLSINGKEVNQPNELQRAVAIHRPGDRLRLEVWRNKELQTFFVELFGQDDSSYRSWRAALDEQAASPNQIRPEPVPDGLETDAAFEIDAWGIGLKQLTDRARSIYEVEHGVYIAFVRRGSVAATGKLPRDVVLLDVNGENVYSLESALRRFEQLTEQQHTVLFKVKHRDGRIAFYEAEPPSQEGTS